MLQSKGFCDMISLIISSYEVLQVKVDPIWVKNGITLRLAKKEDAEAYYVQNFCPLDKDVVRLTGCKKEFSREEVISFFLKSLVDDCRVFFCRVWRFFPVTAK